MSRIDNPFRTIKGGLIDRDNVFDFSFDGILMQGYRGDTLASALLANGVHLAGRSFKYHRPRGIMTAGSEEPSALVTVRGGGRREPNMRATMQELYSGLRRSAKIGGRHLVSMCWASMIGSIASYQPVFTTKPSWDLTKAGGTTFTNHSFVAQLDWGKRPMSAILITTAKCTATAMFWSLALALRV